MRLSRTLLIAVIATATVTLSGCSWPWSHHSSSNAAPGTYSTVSVDIPTSYIAGFGDASTIPTQSVTIGLNGLATWKLKVTGVNYTYNKVHIGINTDRIDAPGNAQQLDLTKGATVDDISCGFTSCSESRSGSFTATLVAGVYHVTVDGTPTQVLVTVIPGAMPLPSSSKTPNPTAGG